MTNLQDFTNRSEVGTIKPWGKATAPSGYLLCDGTAVSRTTYAELYVVLGDTYGAGNGSTTFNVPQLQGKTPQGYDGNTYNLAGTGGANTVTVAVTNNQAVSSVTNTVTNNQAVTVTGAISNTSLTTAQLASHDHEVEHGQPSNAPPQTQRLGNLVPGGPAQDTGTSEVGSTGSGTGHNHAHTLAGSLTGTVAVTSSGGALSGTVTAAGNNAFSPYVVVNYIIKH
jgi:microcystin-dependent protein|tara:strand:- start:4133 stop:4807 length:675 start_codon:yes stop_codon:yes gene_type:complete